MFLIGFLVGTCILSNLEKSAFRSFAREKYIEKAVENIGSNRHRLPILDQSIADGFGNSIERLGPLCHSVCDIEHLVLMRSIIASATLDLYESEYTNLFTQPRLPVREHRI